MEPPDRAARAARRAARRAADRTGAQQKLPLDERGGAVLNEGSVAGQHQQPVVVAV